MSQSESGNYIFRAKTKEAFVIKVLGELLSSTLKFAAFRFDEQGIHLSQVDTYNTRLISFALYRENFLSYKCSRQLNFIANSAHLHQMLKAIKKKDSITLFIKDDDINRLGICVETTDENNKTITYIRITYSQPEVFRDPTGYKFHTSTSSKEFQKMKNLQNISKTMTVTSPRPGYIKFFCDGGEVFSRELTIGSDSEEECVESYEEEYVQTFNTTHITGLHKCANQSGNVQVFIQQDLPLKIKMKAGNLGDLTVFIKSK